MTPGIFRLQLFKPSETFIAAQARALPAPCRPLLVGRKLFGAADAALDSWVPPGLAGGALLRYLLTADPAPFLAGLKSRTLGLMHAHFSVDGLYALPLARKLGVPLLTTLHGFDVTTTRTHFLRSGRPALVRYALLQRALKQGGAGFICVSRFIRDAALRAGFPENKLHVHYIGIDTEQFSPVTAEPVPRFVHVARLVEKKGTRYLLEAFAQVQRRHPEISLDLIGDGPLRSELEAQATQLGIARAVRFHGVKGHDFVRHTLRGATALVLPSVTAGSGDAEGLGIVLLEASATGVPVIGSRHGGIPEAIQENETGLLVAERNVTELAVALDCLVTERTRQQTMGEAARRFVCARFDIRSQSASLYELYRSAQG